MHVCGLTELAIVYLPYLPALEHTQNESESVTVRLV